MKKRIFKSMKLNYIFALVIGALFMIQNVDAKNIDKDLKLSENISEDIVVKSGANITIDLNGYNITTTNKDAIKVELGATLTLKGKGTIEAVGSGVASIYNNGTVTMNDVTLLKDESKGNYYAVLNHGIMTIKSGTVIMKNYKSSSLIDNGYSNFSNSSNEKNGFNSEKAIKNPILTIENGTFDGGRNTVKNDDNATLTINGGHFKNNVQVAVMNWNVATINGGLFEVPTGNDKTTIFVGTDGDTSENGLNRGILTVNGGTFRAEYFLEGKAVSKTSEFTPININGGKFEVTKGLLNSMLTSSPKGETVSDKSIVVKGGNFSMYGINTLKSANSKFLPEGYTMVLIDEENNYVEKGSLDLSAKKSIYYIEKGKTAKLEYEATDLAKKYLTITSSDESIASIENDVIKANEVGKVTIDLNVGGDRDIVEVIVYEVKADETTKIETNVSNIVTSLLDNKDVKGLDKDTSTKLLDAVKTGKTIKTELTTKEVEVSEISKETKEKVNKVLEKEEKIAAIFDINVLIKVDDTSIGKLTELENTVLVSVNVPNNLPEIKTGYTRKYYVIRIHNGETTKLDAELVNGKIQFKTDKFSDYILTYTDEVKKANEENKGKLDDVPKTGIINYTICFIIFGLMTLISIKLLRRN